jgi:bifunctional DNase/RNase
VLGVETSDLVEGVFLARIEAVGGAVDARPSDALNLALVLDVPIRATRAVLDGAAEQESAGPRAVGDGHEAIAADFTALMAAQMSERTSR